MQLPKSSGEMSFCFSYCGKVGNLLKIRTGEMQIFVHGELFATSETSQRNLVINGGASLLSTSSSAASAIINHVELLARGNKSGKLYIIRGVIDRVTCSVKKIDKKQMNNKEYESELQLIQSARLANIDSLVNLKFLSKHSKRSVASVYRDIECGRLPKPFKQGRSSRWLFSVADEYARGKIMN